MTYLKLKRPKHGRFPGRKIIWTEDMLSYLRDNYATNTNWELADHLGIGIVATRMQLYSMGFKRMEMEYWTAEQVRFLRKNYVRIGDVELAEIFEKKWPKNKPWTLKHIEKKRVYLKLYRTPEQIEAVFIRNKRLGRFKFCPINRWILQGVMPEGTIRIWNNAEGGQFKVIKTGGKYVHYARWLFSQHFGKFKRNHVVAFKDRNNMNVVIENLEQIPRSEHGRRNGTKYPSDLRQTMKALKKLNVVIAKIESRQHSKI